MALLAPDPQRIAPGAAVAAADRVPDELADGTPAELARALAPIVGERQVLGRAIDLVRYASDASPYRTIPKAIVAPRDAAQIGQLFAFARERRIPLTFRAAGTSLNGQSQGAGVLVDVRRNFAGIRPEDDGRLARCLPGTVLGHANRVLAPLGRRLGPDPASKDFATVGGVVANNSGGMRCGTTADPYSTVRAMRFVLANGSEVDTSAPDAAGAFAAAAPRLASGLAEIRDEIRADPELAARIRKKFEIKNTTGYRLCAFLDADEPVEIFRRLLVGSEGTLGFVAEALLETVDLPAHTTLSWIHFPSIAAATEIVPALVEAGASAVELMVAPALMVASHNIQGAPVEWRELPLDSAALLVEFGGATEEALAEGERRAGEIAAGADVIRGPRFTRDPRTIEVYWRVREGLHGLVGRLRPPGTALIVEDVCVSPARIAECAGDLQALLAEHGFLTGVAGHASAGNLHFMLTPDFSKEEDRDRYESFMERLVELILGKYDGSLKAEHGTGVNMAPYVEREWGERATAFMWRVKELADPDGILAPGVVLNRDPGVHLRNLKTTPGIEEEATTCVECGFCEPVCPSRDLTTTPRQRIVVRREMARQPEGSPVLRALRRDYEYDALETCAVDGSCALACPLGIDTGALVKELRGRRRTERAERAGLAAARRARGLERGARGALRAGGAANRMLGERPVRAVSDALRSALSEEAVPRWDGGLPGPAPAPPPTQRQGAAAVYFPACINRIFGPPGDGAPRPPLAQALVAVSARAGMPVWIPDDAGGHCCATPWTSKGFRRGAERVANALVERLWGWSGEGRLPIVTDASSCTHAFREPEAALTDQNMERHERLRILDSIEWGLELVPRLEIGSRIPSAAIHPTCSARRLGLADDLAELTGVLAERVHVPPTATCCGFAGDRGLLHPELTASATRSEAAELEAASCDAHLSSNRTCEIGLERATGRRFESFVYLLEELSR